jgi:hypothetical protein
MRRTYRVGQKVSGRDAASPQNLDTSIQVLVSAEKLAQFVDPAKLLDSYAGPRRPLVILAFDEGHMLTDVEQGWSLFSELHRALRMVVELPIFSLFLSTASKFRVFSPETRIRSDPSHRGVNLDLPVLHPISEISFDDLAFPAIEDTLTLNQVIGDKWISHLGRPLYEDFGFLVSFN